MQLFANIFSPFSKETAFTWVICVVTKKGKRNDKKVRNLILLEESIFFFHVLRYGLETVRSEGISERTVYGTFEKFEQKLVDWF